MPETDKKPQGKEQQARDLEERKGAEPGSKTADLDERRSTDPSGDPKAMVLRQLAAIEAMLDDPEVAAAYARFMKKAANKSDLVTKDDIRPDSLTSRGVDRLFYGKEV